MNERERQHYLNQMGVALWYSRCELPGAAASSSFDFGSNCADVLDVINTVAHNKSSLSGVSSAPITSVADILSSLSSTTSDIDATPTNLQKNISSETNKNAPTLVSRVLAAQVSALSGPKSEQGVTSTASNINAPIVAEESTLVSVNAKATLESINIEQVELMFWVGKQSWFLSDSDGEFPEILKQELLLNIASALGEDVKDAKVVNFSWPFFGNARLPGNDLASMQSLLLGYINEQVGSGAFNGFLMGSAVAEMLLGKPLNEQKGKRVELNLSDERGVGIVPTLSLNELLRSPLSKQMAWQHIKHYRLK